MKKYFNRRMILAVVTAVVFVGALTELISCNNNESCMDIEEEINIPRKLLSDAKMEYLDIDDINSDVPTYEQKTIIREAINRADPYVVFDVKKNMYKLIANSNDLNVSGRLFERIKKIIEKTNSDIKEIEFYQDKKDLKILHCSFKKSTLKTNVRRKIDFFETYEPIPDGQNGYDMRWYGYDVYLNNEVTKKITILLAGGATAAAIITALGGNVPAAIVGAIMGYGATVFGTYNEGKGVVIEVVPGFDSSIRSR